MTSSQALGVGSEKVIVTTSIWYKNSNYRMKYCINRIKQYATFDIWACNASGFVKILWIFIFFTSFGYTTNCTNSPNIYTLKCMCPPCFVFQKQQGDDGVTVLAAIFWNIIFLFLYKSQNCDFISLTHPIK